MKTNLHILLFAPSDCSKLQAQYTVGLCLDHGCSLHLSIVGGRLILSLQLFTIVMVIPLHLVYAVEAFVTSN